jgi:hypothetical protein
VDDLEAYIVWVLFIVATHYMVGKCVNEFKEKQDKNKNAQLKENCKIAILEILGQMNGMHVCTHGLLTMLQEMPSMQNTGLTAIHFEDAVHELNLGRLIDCKKFDDPDKKNCMSSTDGLCRCLIRVTTSKDMWISLASQGMWGG